MEALEDTKVIVLVLVNFSKAFNTVSLYILLAFLSFFKISIWKGSHLIFGKANSQFALTITNSSTQTNACTHFPVNNPQYGIFLS